MDKIYLAIPYSKVDKELSFEIANRIAAMLMCEGKNVFSPISMSHCMAKNNRLPGDWEFWEKFDTEFIWWCDYLIVIMMDGWKESTGVIAEIKIAETLNKPVYYFDVHGNYIKPKTNN